MFFQSILGTLLCCCSYVHSELVFVSILFRHGDRTPINFYPNDPYNDPSYWPVGPGQLTNVGKLQHYHLGQWFRDRYSGLVGENYSKENLYITSTDVDRTLMSAESNLAGLFPPEGKQVWNDDIKWQPIPIHTTPEKLDKVLSMKKPCPRYDLEKRKYMQSEEMSQFISKYKPLFDYVSKHAGDAVHTPTDLEYIHNTLFIEETNNFTLPDWTHPIYPEPMRTVAAFSFSINAKTLPMKRLKGGLLLKDMINHMVAKTKQKLKKKKLWMYSAHDITIANLLNTLNIFDLHCPPYASTIMVELHERNESYFVNIFYKNSTTLPPYNMTIPGCDFDCELNHFITLTKEVALTDSEWEKECHSTHFLDLIPDNDLDNSFATVVLLIMAGLLVLLAVSLACYLQKSRHPNAHMYERI